MAIDTTVRPETGKLLAWNNGNLNPAALHHGMKVRKGVKYVIPKWYRERPWGLAMSDTHREWSQCSRSP